MKGKRYRRIAVCVATACLNFFSVSAQHAKPSFHWHFDTPTVTNYVLKKIEDTIFSPTEGVRQHGIRINYPQGVPFPPEMRFTASAAWVVWFQLSGDVRTRQTLWYAADSIGRAEVFIEQGVLGFAYQENGQDSQQTYSVLQNITANTWQMLGVRVQHCSVQIYVGCELRIEIALSSSLFERRHTAQVSYLGGNPQGDRFLGKLDEFQGFANGLADADLNYLCAKNFPEVSSSDAPTTDAQATAPQRAAIEDSSEAFRPYGMPAPWTLYAPTDTVSLSFDFQYGTLRATLFAEQFDTPMTLFTFQTQQATYTLRTTADMLVWVRKTVQHTDSLLVPAQLLPMRTNDLLWEVSTCGLSLTNHCRPQATVPLPEGWFAEPIAAWFPAEQHSVFVEALAYYPFLFTTEEKASRFCLPETSNAQVPSRDKPYTQEVLAALFDTRKTYLPDAPIDVPSEEIIVSFWDFDRVDGDTISAMFNEEVILPYHALTHEKVSRTLHLQSDGANILQIYAHSDGAEGNNTVRVGILAGGGYYHEADIATEALLNGGIRLRYRPPKE